MDFYNCPYVDVMPFRNGNEYDEHYRCVLQQESHVMVVLVNSRKKILDVCLIAE